MSNEISVRHSTQEIQTMAMAIAKSGMFGIKTPEQAMALMFIAQAEGRHPGSVAQDYNVIQGRPALKADAMLARYQGAGGKVRWVSMTDECVSAVFSHPASGDVEISWTMERAANADLLKSGMFKKYPRQMLRARVISEGVRASFPGVIGGMYTPEEVQEYVETGKQEVIDNPKRKKFDPVKALGAAAEILPDCIAAVDTERTPEAIKKARHDARVALNGWVLELLPKIGYDKAALDSFVNLKNPVEGATEEGAWKRQTLEAAWAIFGELQALVQGEP